MTDPVRNPSRSRRCNRGLTLPNVTVKRAECSGSWEDAEFGMIRKPEDLPENAADKHFAEECCRYEQPTANCGSVGRGSISALVGLHGMHSIPGMVGFALHEHYGCTSTKASHSGYSVFSR